MKGHIFGTMVSKSSSKSPNHIPSLNKRAISLNDGVFQTLLDESIRRILTTRQKLAKKKEEASSETSSCGDFVRWARLELAQAYAHYPLKVACLPFHHHRFFVLGLQRYDKNLYFQIFLQNFSLFLKIFAKMGVFSGKIMKKTPQIPISIQCYI